MISKQIPRIPLPMVLDRVKAYLDPIEYNPHKCFLATTGSGKSYLMRHAFLPVYEPSRIVLVDIKAGGARTWHGWGNPATDLRPGFGRGPDGKPHWHVFVSQNSRDATRQVSRLLNIIKAEGDCVLVIDDARRITQTSPGLNQSGNIDDLITNCREIGVSVLIAANSSNWLTSAARDQCGAYIIGQMSNAKERKEFAAMANVPDEYRAALATVRRREFVYIDSHDNGAIAITAMGQ